MQTFFIVVWHLAYVYSPQSPIWMRFSLSKEHNLQALQLDAPTPMGTTILLNMYSTINK